MFMENNLQDIFVPYEESLEIKQLGFDEYCLGAWGEWGFMTPNDVSSLSDYITQEDLDNKWIEEDNVCLASTFSQAFKFFRDKHQLYPVCFPQLDKWVIEIKELRGWEGNPCVTGYPDLEYDTYEEARLECLRKLIEICKK